MSRVNRSERLAARARELGATAAIATDPADLRWLTGFTGSNGLAISSESASLFVSDFRYTEQAAAEVDPAFEVVIADGDLFKEAAGRLGDEGILAFDAGQVTVSRAAQIESDLPPGWSAVAARNVVRPLRFIKDPAEIETIREAARIADEAFSIVVGQGLVGRTEADVAWGLERAIRELGGEGVSFPPIVASGAHGALPHAAPRDVKIPAGVLVVIDWGAIHSGYCSDCTRTVATGTVGGREREVYEIVLAAQRAGCGALRPGPTGSEIDALARQVIIDSGFGEMFGHGLGHGVGLEIHEGPNLGRRDSETQLEAGMVVTVEPGIYLPGEFGVRIEDLCVLDADGAYPLTALPLELTEVD